MKIAILFGGSGYISNFLLRELIAQKRFDKYFVRDIKELKGFDIEVSAGLVDFAICDARESIDPLKFSFDSYKSWVFNLAAIHREPGHAYKEYFDTNVAGAKNVTEFCIAHGIKNIYFTSSIAPYGKSFYARDESSPLYPETAYGISKSMAELIHREWLAGQVDARLIIVRPSVIYGPNDPGNVYRMIQGLKKGTFVLPDGGNIIKGYGYVYGLIDSVLFTMDQDKKYICYNYTENPTETLQHMVDIAKSELDYRKPTLKLPVSLLTFIAFFLQVCYKVIGKKSDIHPVRVRKAAFPTNVIPRYLIDNGFIFKYDFRSSLKHWKSISPENFN